MVKKVETWRNLEKKRNIDYDFPPLIHEQVCWGGKSKQLNCFSRNDLARIFQDLTR